MKILAARYVVPVAYGIIDDGAVAIDGERIAAVGSSTELRRQFPDASFESLGDAAILPGFTNVHSHLELTAMRGFLDRFDDDFSAWLLTLTKVRSERLTDEDVAVGALLGAVEGARAGVTTFGDIGRLGAHGFDALKKTGLRGVVYQETEFSPDDRTAAEDFAKLVAKFEALKAGETDLVRAGISPHSPYTVGAKLFELIGEFAIANDVRITIHAAESSMEDELLKNGTGFFTGVYEKFGLNWTSPRCSTIEYLERLGVLRARPLLAHCVRASEGDLELIKAAGASIAHCSKSNAKFGHGAAPFAKFREKGIATGLGSDSVASNNNCDMIEEARFALLTARNVAAKAILNSEAMIESMTLGGARALGIDSQTGSLEAGKQADICVLSLDNIAQMPVHDAATAIVFASNARDVSRTIVAGREIYRDGAMTAVDEIELKSKIREIASKMH